MNPAEKGVVVFMLLVGGVCAAIAGAAGLACALLGALSATLILAHGPWSDR